MILNEKRLLPVQLSLVGVWIFAEAEALDFVDLEENCVRYRRSKVYCKILGRLFCTYF